MLSTSPRFAKLRATITTVGVLTMIGGLILIVLGFGSAHADHQVWLNVTGGLTITLGLLVIAGTFLLIKIESNTSRLYNQVLDLHEVCKQQRELLVKIADNSALSDVAKSLANREQEHETIRAAIRADLRMEKWEAARHLVEEMEQRFGLTEEAESLRRDTNEAQIETMRRRLGEATRIIEGLMDQREWDKALHEVERLHRALPDEPRVAKLQIQVDERKAACKAKLLEEWHDAVRREDVDAAISVLQELDGHLTRQEARSLEESARDIFKAKLLQLGMQFQFAVTEKRWRDALEVGVQITEEFPNAQMAREVQAAMDGLRKRAGLHPDVEITAANRDQPKA